VVAAMNAVVPSDWAGFFATWIDDIAPHPPDIFSHGGWKLVYAATPTDFYQQSDAQRKILGARYSLGFIANREDVIGDVISGSPAERVGIGVGGKLLALDDRGLTPGDAQHQLDDALVAHERNVMPLRALIFSGNVYREYTIPYRGGPRFPRLERTRESPDVLSEIAKPL